MPDQGIASADRIVLETVNERFNLQMQGEQRIDTQRVGVPNGVVVHAGLGQTRLTPQVRQVADANSVILDAVNDCCVEREVQHIQFLVVLTFLEDACSTNGVTVDACRIGYDVAPCVGLAIALAYSCIAVQYETQAVQHAVAATFVCGLISVLAGSGVVNNFTSLIPPVIRLGRTDRINGQRSNGILVVCQM